MTILPFECMTVHDSIQCFFYSIKLFFLLKIYHIFHLTLFFNHPSNVVPHSPALSGMQEKIMLHQNNGKTHIYRHAGKYEVPLMKIGRLIYSAFYNNFFHLKEKISIFIFRLSLSTYSFIFK